MEETTFAAEAFEWDEYNADKIRRKHKVQSGECEEVFFNEPMLILPDETHSKSERRHWALGKTNDGRELFVVFTERKGKIRIISARDMSKKERASYHEKIKKDS